MNAYKEFKSLGHIVHTFLDLNKDKVLQHIDDTNEVVTYFDVLKWSTRLAIRLKEKGVTRDDIISSCTANHKYSSVLPIAIQFAGAISSNYDPNLSQLDTVHLLKLIEPKILFVDEDSLEMMEMCLQKAGIATEIVVIGRSDKYSNFLEYIEPHKKEKTFELTQIEDINQTAFIFFSSGTTGLPKGICLSHKALLSSVTKSIGIDYDKSNSNVMLIFTSLYWISAVFTLLRCIVEGYSMVVRKEFDPLYTWKLIEEYKVTTMYLAPYLANDLLYVKPANVDASSLKYLLMASAPVPDRLMTDLKQALPTAQVTIGYGQTEAAGFITLFKPSEYELQLKKPRSCGKIGRGLEWKVVDPSTEKILGPHEEGEMRIKSNGDLMTGYYKMDTSSVFDSDGYMKTGDVVYYDSDECFYVVDRYKEIFKFRGWHILPTLLENIVLTHPAVKEAVIIGIPHEIDGEHPMAVVVLCDGYDDSSTSSIEAFVNERVSDNQKLRAGVRVVESIPKTVTGKSIKRVVKKQVLESLK